jgi:hypothetical protein
MVRKVEVLGQPGVERLGIVVQGFQLGLASLFCTARSILIETSFAPSRWREGAGCSGVRRPAEGGRRRRLAGRGLWHRCAQPDSPRHGEPGGGARPRPVPSRCPPGSGTSTTTGPRFLGGKGRLLPMPWRCLRRSARRCGRSCARGCRWPPTAPSRWSPGRGRLGQACSPYRRSKHTSAPASSTNPNHRAEPDPNGPPGAGRKPATTISARSTTGGVPIGSRWTTGR